MRKSISVGGYIFPFRLSKWWITSSLSSRQCPTSSCSVYYHMEAAREFSWFLLVSYEVTFVVNTDRLKPVLDTRQASQASWVLSGSLGGVTRSLGPLCNVHELKIIQQTFCLAKFPKYIMGHFLILIDSNIYFQVDKISRVCLNIIYWHHCTEYWGWFKPQLSRFE